MRTFLVGGAVRDKLLGRTSKDHDYVVTDSSHDELIALGFIGVGRDHTVYLHPQTREEYTLAEGLEEDLQRRDLTINSMAMEGERIIDPFGGQKDLQDKVLRHVREENFYTDPLRVYRVFRFASEFPEFEISKTTMHLLEKVSTTEAFRSIFSERILKELEKVFSSACPTRFFQLLKNTQMLHVHFHELDQLAQENWLHTLKVFGKVPTYASLFIHLSENESVLLSERLLVSNEKKLSARVAAKFFHTINLKMTAEEMVEIFYQMDAFRRPFLIMTLVSLLKGNRQDAEGAILLKAYQLACEVSASDISSNLTGKDIGRAIKVKRIIKLKSSQS